MVRQLFSPGTFTICCACPHPKVIGLVVLEKREGPYALLNAIISRFVLLPHFFVYDFGWGVLRSAVGNLLLFLAFVVIISDLFHVVNHVCNDKFNRRSFSPLDGKNTVAHEQQNSPIAAMMKSLRAFGQGEFMRTMQLHTVLHTVQAQAHATCTYPLLYDYIFRQFFSSRRRCTCGCGQREEQRPLPSPPSSLPSSRTQSWSDPATDSTLGEKQAGAWHDPPPVTSAAGEVAVFAGGGVPGASGRCGVGTSGCSGSGAWASGHFARALCECPWQGRRRVAARCSRRRPSCVL